uniref:(northern house mosquito) hypothetical protein n=1 Tax=Culex pipiens TaxID=7175 RepID=A0A8D7ZXQ5_CULPI
MLRSKVTDICCFRNWSARSWWHILTPQASDDPQFSKKLLRLWVILLKIYTALHWARLCITLSRISSPPSAEGPPRTRGNRNNNSTQLSPRSPRESFRGGVSLSPGRKKKLGPSSFHKQPLQFPQLHAIHSIFTNPEITHAADPDGRFGFGFCANNWTIF